MAAVLPRRQPSRRLNTMQALRSCSDIACAWPKGSLPAAPNAWHIGIAVDMIQIAQGLLAHLFALVAPARRLGLGGPPDRCGVLLVLCDRLRALKATDAGCRAGKTTRLMLTAARAWQNQPGRPSNAIEPGHQAHGVCSRPNFGRRDFPSTKGCANHGFRRADPFGLCSREVFEAKRRPLWSPKRCARYSPVSTSRRTLIEA